MRHDVSSAFDASGRLVVARYASMVASVYLLICHVEEHAACCQRGRIHRLDSVEGAWLDTCASSGQMLAFETVLLARLTAANVVDEIAQSTVGRAGRVRCGHEVSCWTRGAVVRVGLTGGAVGAALEAQIVADEVSVGAGRAGFVVERNRSDVAAGAVGGVHFAGLAGWVASSELVEDGVEEVSFCFYHAHRFVNCEEVTSSTGDAVARDVRAYLAVRLAVAAETCRCDPRAWSSTGSAGAVGG